MVTFTAATFSDWKILTRYASIFVAAVGSLVLLGWLLDITFFTHIIPGSVAMNPLTAVAFILLAGALWLLQSPDAQPAMQLRGRLIALAAVLIAAIKLLDILLGLDIGLDRLLFSAKLDLSADGIPNRMAPNTALVILLIGCALGCLDWRRWPRLSLAFTLAAALVALFALLGYVYDANAFYRVAGFIPMATHTAAVSLVMCVGILAARPASPLMWVITNDTVAGMIARRLLPATILVPLVLGWLRLQGERLGLFPPEVGVMLFAMGIMLIFLTVVWYTARALLVIETARTLAEARIQALNQELASSNKELEAFSYSVSHDLRAPLRAVNGFSRILLEEYAADLPDDATRYLRLVSTNATQMGRLIDDLLAFSRLSRQPLRRQAVSLKNIAQQVYHELREVEDGRVIDFVIEDMPDAMGDQALLKQVYVNLLGNAIKYTGPRETARIEVGCEQRDDQTIYFVRDNGVGFDMKYAGKLFSVFQRLHSPDAFEGTGIGLAISQRVVHRHGGRIWVNAAEDRGATFYFVLGEGNDENAG